MKYTVTIEVEADAIGPAQAIRQALDWARDTESGEGVVTVRASDLSPLRAAVADGRVSQLFTGPVTTPGPICQKPAGVPVAEAREIAQRVCEAATRLKDAHNLDAPARGQLAARIRAAGDDLHTLTYMTPGPIRQKPAGVDPDKVRALVSKWRQKMDAESRAMSSMKIGAHGISYYVDGARSVITGITKMLYELEALTDDQ